MRISTLFLACFCGVAVPGGIASSWIATTSWSTWRQAEDAILATHAVAAAQRAQTSIGAEVGSYASQLRATAPDVDGLRRLAPLTDSLLQDAMRDAAASGLSSTPVQGAATRIAEMRARAFAEMAKPLAERDASLANATQALRNEAADTMGVVASAAARQLAALQPATARMVEVATAVMDIRDQVGRRNTVITSWIGGAPITIAQLETTQRQSGRIDQAWSLAERLLGTMPDYPTLQAALHHQRETLMKQSEPRWGGVMQLAATVLGGASVTWPMAQAPFRAWAIPAQAEILLLRDAAPDQALDIADSLGRTAQSAFLAALALALAMMVLTATSVLVLLRRVAAPLRALTGSVTGIADGQLEVAVPGAARQDELGEMARAVETLRAVSMERRAMQVAQQQGQQAQIERAGRVDLLLRDFEAETADMLRAVAAAASEMDATAAGMAETATSGNQRASAVASASQQASGNVQTVAAAAEELSASITEVARQVRDSAGRASAASDAAQETDRTVRGLSEAAKRIGEVVHLITDIASQTNLLALNATIEAARAGDSGKGFAVVAGEVKNLASQTAKATEEIGQQIAAMQAETAGTVQAIGAIARMIGEVNDATRAVAEAAGQQAEATREIGRAVAQAATGTEAASRHAAGVSEDAERTGHAADEVRGAASELAKQAETLRGRMDGFLVALRQA